MLWHHIWKEVYLYTLHTYLFTIPRLPTSLTLCCYKVITNLEVVQVLKVYWLCIKIVYNRHYWMIITIIIVSHFYSYSWIYCGCANIRSSNLSTVLKLLSSCQEPQAKVHLNHITLVYSLAIMWNTFFNKVKKNPALCVFIIPDVVHFIHKQFLPCLIHCGYWTILTKR